MPTSMSLGHLVDLALGTPDAGSVNFHMLHSLLHAMLTHLNIVHLKTEFSDVDQEDLLRVGDPASALQRQIEENSNVLNPVSHSTGARSDVTRDGIKGQKIEGEKEDPVLLLSVTPYHKLEKRVEDLEKHWIDWNSLPSNSDLWHGMKKVESADEKQPQPMTDMWQQLQLGRKVETNAQGISKLMSLIEEVMREIQQLQTVNETFRDQLEKLHKKADYAKELEDFTAKLKALETEFKCLDQSLEDINRRIPTDEIFNEFVTWSAFEDSMKNLKPLATQDKMVVEMSNQTDQPIPEPSTELKELLEKIEKLMETQETLMSQIKQMEINFNKKADRDELIGLEEIDTLKKSCNQNVDLLHHLQDVFRHLHEEVVKLSDATQRLSDESINHQNHLETLFCSFKNLDERKADREYVQTEVDLKANKEILDEKVNRKNFDMTCDDINNTINDIVNKLMGHEVDWKKISTDLNGKLDRLEFGPFRDELEKQLRLLEKKMRTEGGGGGGREGGKDGLTAEEAAGFRKQLLQTFHCISCSRPLDMKTTSRPVPCLPAVPGLPESHSMRPYTVFELDQIRQLGRSQVQQQQPLFYQEAMDQGSKARQCGGSHTLTFPHKRLTKISNVCPLNPPNSSFDPITSSRNEQHLLFNSKGSTTKSKLPNVHVSTNKSTAKPTLVAVTTTEGSRCQSPLQPLNHQSSSSNNTVPVQGRNVNMRSKSMVSAAETLVGSPRLSSSATYGEVDRDGLLLSMINMVQPLKPHGLHHPTPNDEYNGITEEEENQDN